MMSSRSMGSAYCRELWCYIQEQALHADISETWVVQVTWVLFKMVRLNTNTDYLKLRKLEAMVKCWVFGNNFLESRSKSIIFLLCDLGQLTVCLVFTGTTVKLKWNTHSGQGSLPIIPQQLCVTIRLDRILSSFTLKQIIKWPPIWRLWLLGLIFKFLICFWLWNQIAKANIQWKISHAIGSKTSLS